MTALSTHEDNGQLGQCYQLIAPVVQKGIAALLPDHITPELFARTAAMAMTKDPSLAEADLSSLIMALTRCASDGLLPDGREAALVTYATKVKNQGREQWVRKVQYLPMVDGVLKRARQSGQIQVIGGKAVYEGDHFDYWMDENGEHIRYRPQLAARGPVLLAFAYARLTGGELMVEVMTRDEIERVRAASKGGAGGAWGNWYDRMAVKSVLHRLVRRLPNASELIGMLEQGQPMDFHQEPAPPRADPRRALTAAVSQQATMDAEQLARFQQIIAQFPGCKSRHQLNDLAASLRALPLDEDQDRQARHAYQAASRQFEPAQEISDEPKNPA